jgi:hypothetical protein
MQRFSGLQQNTTDFQVLLLINLYACEDSRPVTECKHICAVVLVSAVWSACLEDTANTNGGWPLGSLVQAEAAPPAAATPAQQYFRLPAALRAEAVLTQSTAWTLPASSSLHDSSQTQAVQLLLQQPVKQ